MSAPDSPAGDATWSPMARSVREPSLLRLAQSIDDLNLELARALCLSGLAAMVDPAAAATNSQDESNKDMVAGTLSLPAPTVNASRVASTNA